MARFEILQKIDDVVAVAIGRAALIGRNVGVHPAVNGCGQFPQRHVAHVDWANTDCSGGPVEPPEVDLVVVL